MTAAFSCGTDSSRNSRTGRNCVPSSASNGGMPSPVVAEIATACGYLSRKRFRRATAVQLVDFVEDHQRRLFRRADFLQHGVDRCNLFLGLRMAHVHDVQQQIGLHHFFERGLERLDQSVRQFADETDRVGQQNILVRRQAQSARGRVERGEQFVLRQNVRAGERVEQGGFAGVRVTDDGCERPVIALAAVALRGTLAADDFEFARDFGDAILHAAAVGFQLRFTVTPRMPMPPFCRDKWPQNRVRRGSRC